jgi:hypothetical protein
MRVDLVFDGFGSCVSPAASLGFFSPVRVAG